MALSMHDMNPDSGFYPVKNEPIITFNHMEDTIQNGSVNLVTQTSLRILLTDLLLMTVMATVMIILFS